MVVSLIVSLAAGISVLSYAQTAQTVPVKKADAAVDVLRGTVVSVDAGKSEIVVKENKTGIQKTVVVDPSVIPTVKADDHVKVTLKAGSNVAESVKKIVKIAQTVKKSSGK